MRRFWFALGVAPFVHLTCAQIVGGGGRPSAVRGGVAGFAEEIVSDVSVTAVHAIAHGDGPIVEGSMEQLEVDGQTTGEAPYPPPRVHEEHASGVRTQLPMNYETINGSSN